MAVTDHKWAFILALVVACMVMSPRSEAYGRMVTGADAERRNFGRRKKTGRITGPLHRM